MTRSMERGLPWSDRPAVTFGSRCEVGAVTGEDPNPESWEPLLGIGFGVVGGLAAGRIIPPLGGVQTGLPLAPYLAGGNMNFSLSFSPGVFLGLPLGGGGRPSG